MKRALAAAIFVGLTGCAPKASQIPQPAQQRSFLLLSEEENARLYDISFPVGIRAQKIAVDEYQAIFTFRTKLSQKELIEFYRTELLYCGWQEKALFEAQESCLIFQKPKKQCCVTIRSEDTGHRVVIFTGFGK